MQGKIGRGMLMLTQLPDTTSEEPEYEYVKETDDKGKTVRRRDAPTLDRPKPPAPRLRPSCSKPRAEPSCSLRLPHFALLRAPPTDRRR